MKNLPLLLTLLTVAAYTTGQRLRERQQRRLADDDGLSTLEYVLLGALVLAAVSTVGLIFRDQINTIGTEIQGILGRR